MKVDNDKVSAVNLGPIVTGHLLVHVPAVLYLAVETGYVIVAVRNLTHAHTINVGSGHRMNDVMTGNDLGPRTGCALSGLCLALLCCHCDIAVIVRFKVIIIIIIFFTQNQHMHKPW